MPEIRATCDRCGYEGWRDRWGDYHHMTVPPTPHSFVRNPGTERVSVPAPPPAVPDPDPPENDPEYGGLDKWVPRGMPD